MVLSGIAKELDPHWRKKTRRRDSFWSRAFDQIDRLVKLQLVACPESPIHETESSLDDRYESVLERLYEHLASGVRLRSPEHVLMRQLGEAFEAWSTDREPDWGRISPDDVIRGRLDHWSERLHITAKIDHWSGRIEGRRDTRDRMHETLRQLWDQWAADGQMSFEDRLDEQLHVVADAAIEAHRRHMQRLRRIVIGEEGPFDPMKLVAGWPVQLVMWLLSRLEKKGVPEDERPNEVARFLHSALLVAKRRAASLRRRR